MSSPASKTYPDYIRDGLEARMEFSGDYNPDYPPRVGLPKGMEFIPTSDLVGKRGKTAELIIKRKLIAIVVKRGDRDKLKIPPGFLTDLSFNPLTKIPQK